MSLLDTPTGRALLDEATLSAGDVASCEERLAQFLERYLPLFYRKEQRLNAGVVVLRDSVSACPASDRSASVMHVCRGRRTESLWSHGSSC